VKTDQVAASDITAAYGKKLRDEVAAERLYSRGVGHLPLDPERARVELTEEQRAQRNSRPRTRRWRGLAKLDDKIDKLAHRQADAAASLQRVEESLRRAPEDDAHTLASWLAGGEKGDRPAASLYERERERDAARLLLDAIAVELDDALAERLAYIEKHRARMLEDAQRDVAEARDALLGHVRGLHELRDVLLTARETLAWAATYPEPVDAYGFPNALALGLRTPVERTLHTTARVEYGSVVSALEEDAKALADAHAEAVKERLGTAGPRTPLREAMWDSDPDMQTFKREELERARRLAEFHDPDKLAAEVRDR
jgi:hypothetical protein